MKAAQKNKVDEELFPKLKKDIQKKIISHRKLLKQAANNDNVSEDEQRQEALRLMDGIPY